MRWAGKRHVLVRERCGWRHDGPMRESGLTIAPGVAGVLMDDQERVLLQRRRVGQGWAPISGHLEPGETIIDGLRREVTEETALPISDLGFVGVYSDPAFQVVTFGDGRRVQFVTTLFTAGVATPEQLRGNQEATAWDWFPAHALPENLLPYARRWLCDALALHDRPIVC